MNSNIRILLLDCDPGFNQSLVTQLAEADIQVDALTSESQLLEQLQAGKERHELVLLGQLADPSHAQELISKLRQNHPIITLTTSEHAWQRDWSSDTDVYCSVDRETRANILALVIQSAIRHWHDHQRNQALLALVTAAERAGTANTEEQLYQELYEEASELLPGLDGFIIAQYDAQSNEVAFPFSYRHDRRIHISSRRDGKSVAEYVWLTKEPLLLPYGDEIFRLKHGLNPPDDNLGYCSSEIVVPMFLEGKKVYGAVFVLTDDPEVHYTLEHLQTLTIFTNQVALTIRNFIQIKEADQLRDATAALAGQHGREKVLRAIVAGAHQIVRSDFTGLILQDEHGQLEKVQPVIPEDFFYKFGDARQAGGLTRAAIESRHPIIVPDTSKNPLVKDSVLAEGIRSMLVLPLIHNERVLGVLYTHTFTFRDFVARDVALWTAFATQAASALDRVLEEERQIRDYQSLVRDLSNLDEHLGLKETLVRVATTARSVFDSDTCRLFYIDPFIGQVVDTAWAEGDLAQHHVEQMPRSGGSTQFVLRTKQPYFYPDMQKGPGQRQELLEAGLKSSASLPLRYGTRDIGVLHCNYFTKTATFNEHYRTLMEAFGARAAVALVRAGREARAKIWQSLNREIINCTSVSQLYQLFTETAHKALGADLSIFYPFDPIVNNSKRHTLEDECVRVGQFRTPWQRPKGGRQGGVFKEITKRRPLLIVNELKRTGKFSSRLTRREGICAFVAMRLEVIMPDTKQPHLAGILFLNYRQPVMFQDSDLEGLRISNQLIAAGILRLRLQADLQQAFKHSNDQLRAVIDIFRTQEAKQQDLNLNHIAEHAARALSFDVCTIIEFDTSIQKFKGRGNYGLRQPEFGNVTLRSRFKDAYMYQEGPTVIEDVRKDPLMRVSQFVKREGIHSTVVCPLRVEGESLGLLFGNYRKLIAPSKDSLEALKLFADVAAHALHRARLNTLLNEKQMREERQHLLVWVSMVEDMWQHTLVQKASAIRNHAFTLVKRLERHPRLPDSMSSVPEILKEMEHLAEDIANAPPRVPRAEEMMKELVPIGPLLQEVADRETSSMRLRGNLQHQIEVDVRRLGGVQINGYRRWLIYIIESLFQNAFAAMPHAGKISIIGLRQKQMIELRIQDTGRGVPRKLRNKLFQVAITGRRNPKGLGIGSLLVTTLVEEHGGTIELEKPGPGDTTVLLRLPIAQRARKR